jgi:uncharacterized membrane protein
MWRVLKLLWGCEHQKKSRREMMRIMTLAVAAALAVSLAVPASAAKKKAAPAPTVASFEKCEQLAIERGVPHGQTGHASFVAQCMGKRPTNRPTD